MKQSRGVRSLVSFFFILGFALIFTTQALSQFTEPQAGEIYKEYSLGLTGESWRVTDPNTTYGPPAWQFLPNPTITFNNVDLSLATKAELVIDKWGGHTGTMNKRFRFNGNDSIMIPELTTTPGSSVCYMQQTNVTVPVPLGHLVSGTNTLQGSCDNQSCYYFNWGQWGWYGVMLRVYYSASKPHPTGTITSHASGSTFGDNPVIAASATAGAGVSRVEFFAYYEGFDVDGDGVYKDWQRSYRRGSALDLQNHLGTVTSPPYTVTWDTEWVPDQTAGSVKFMARVRDNDGVWSVMPVVDNLTFQRSSGSVRMYKAFNVPENFWARASSMTQFSNFRIPQQDSTAIATAVRMYITTWNGVDGDGDVHWYKVNDYQIPGLIGLNHQYKFDIVTIPLSAIKYGVNKFQAFASTTGHHGIEIMWPGPAFLVKYQNTIPPPPPPSSVIQSDEFNTPALNTSVWNFVDYVGDGNYNLNGNQLEIMVPGPNSHDIYTNQNHAPRMVQNITDIQNFGVEAKFDTPLDSAFQLHGILVEQDASNLVRFDFYSNPTHTILNALTLTNGTAQIRISQIFGPRGTAPLYLRVHRDGSQWILRYSSNGTTWDSAGSFNHALVATSIGPFAGNAGNPAPSFTGRIDYFRSLDVVPVQLASLTATLLTQNQVRIHWRTVTETNNFGFEVQKSFGSPQAYQTIPNSFVPGHGTTLEPREYWFTDAVTSAGTWYYRLKQIDLDGTIHYTEGVHVNTLTAVEEKVLPREYALSQNYPNPFNPTTRIEYALPKETDVKIEIFNTLGQSVATLVDSRKPAGYHTATFEAVGLGTGIYIYKLSSPDATITRKMLFVK